MSKLITIRTFGNSIDSEMVRSYLESLGVKTKLFTFFKFVSGHMLLFKFTTAKIHYLTFTNQQKMEWE